MRKFLIASVVILLAVSTSEAGVFNAVNVGDIVEVVNASEPSIAFGYDFVSEDSIQTATVSLVTYTSREYALGSLRAGYSGDELDQPSSLIAGIELVTPNIIQRFVPESLRNWNANLKVLKLIPSMTLVGGYSIDDEKTDQGDKFVFGATFGPKITF